VTSRLPALIDYLIALFTSASTLGQATPPVTIFDGPVTTRDPAPLQLYVGLSDPENTGAELAGDTVQEWAALGRRARNETTVIHCAALAWSGADDARTVRLAATGIVAAVETLLQADATQLGGNVLYPDPGVNNIALTQSNQGGSTATVAFDLVLRSRIGG